MRSRSDLTAITIPPDRISSQPLSVAKDLVWAGFAVWFLPMAEEPEDEGYSAYSPTLPGCFSNGRTIEEAKRNIREAVQAHLASLIAHGDAAPQNEHLVHVEELTVAIP